MTRSPRRAAALAVAALALAACGGERPASAVGRSGPPTIAGTGADGLPATAAGLALDGSRVVAASNVPAGPDLARRALAGQVRGDWGIEMPWHDQVAQPVALGAVAGFSDVRAWVAALDRRESFGNYGKQAFSTVVVVGRLAQPERDAGAGPVWGLTDAGALRGEGTAHRLIARVGDDFVTIARLRGTREDILAAVHGATPWRSYLTRLRRAVEKGADLGQLRDELVVLRSVPPDARGDAAALLATRARQVEEAAAALPTGDVLARAMRLSEAVRLHADAELLVADGLAARLAAWCEALARDAGAAADAARPDSAAAAGWRIVWWRALSLSPRVAGGTDTLPAAAAARRFLARVAAGAQVVAVTPVGRALPGIAEGLVVAHPAQVVAPSACDFSALATTPRSEELFQPYTVANPAYADWQKAYDAKAGALAATGESVAAANDAANRTSGYDTSVTTHHVDSQGNTQYDTHETVTNEALKQANQEAERRAAALERQQAELRQELDEIKARRPPERLARSGGFIVEWQDWSGTAVAPATLTATGGAPRDLTTRLAVKESDRRTAGFSAAGMLPEEGVPAEDHWRTRAQVEADLTPRLAALSQAAVVAAMLDETRATAAAGAADADELAWSAWLLGGAGADSRPPGLLDPQQP